MRRRAATMNRLTPWLSVVTIALGLAGQTINGAPKLYVTNSAGDSVHVIDLRTFKVVDEIKTGDRPHGASASADGRRFFTSVEGDHTLLVVDTATDKVVKSIKLSGLPNQCAVTPDGKYVGVPIRGG